MAFKEIYPVLKRSNSDAKLGICLKEEISSIKPARILALLSVIVAVPILMRLIEKIPITTKQSAYFLLNAAILTVFLVWLVPKVRLSRLAGAAGC